MADEKAAVPGGTGLPPDLQTASATKEDRSMAMIAYLIGLVGILGPLILFLIKKDGASKFLQFHMKDSLFFQLALLVVYIALGIFSAIGSIITAGILGCIIMPVIMLVWLGAVIYTIIGGLQINSGKDFEFPLVGPWVRKSL